MEDLVKLLQSAAQGMIDDAAIARGTQWIELMKKQTPFAHAILMGLLYQTPEAVLDAAAGFNSALVPYRRNEYALTYIRELQKKLRGGKQP